MEQENISEEEIKETIETEENVKFRLLVSYLKTKNISNSMDSTDIMLFECLSEKIQTNILKEIETEEVS